MMRIVLYPHLIHRRHNHHDKVDIFVQLTLGQYKYQVSNQEAV